MKTNYASGTGQYRTLLLVMLLAASFVFGLGSTARSAEPDKRPNIVLMLADDMGYGDLACYGNTMIKTPNLDRLAAEGVRFTDCHCAGANCSPSRTGLLTGRTPYRVGVYDWIPEGSPMHVRASEISVARLLKSAGYATCHVGKWHLNGGLTRTDQPQPGDHGFDYWFSTQNNADPSHFEPVNFVRNGQPLGKLEGYSSTIIVDEAIGWLKRRRVEQPFCLFVWFHSPHEPLGTSEAFTRLYPEVDSKRATYYGNVSQLDHEIGRLLKRLDDLQLRDETFVMFTSDNGPATTVAHPFGSAGTLRGRKGEVYEGGHRVPGMIRWPGHTQPGQECRETINGTDLLPTLCAIAGTTVPTDRRLDGTSILPALMGTKIERKVPLYWQYNRARSENNISLALREGDWKLLATVTGPRLPSRTGDLPGDMQVMKTAELDRFELYDLAKDPGETSDLAAREPERVKQMAKSMTDLYHEIRAEGPTWPAYQPPKPVNRVKKSPKAA